jgi:hypothetical protein
LFCLDTKKGGRHVVKIPNFLHGNCIIDLFSSRKRQCTENGIQLKDLIGIWKLGTTNDMLISFIKFYDYEAYRSAYDVEKKTRPTDKSQIKFDGKDITFIPSESPMCKTNQGKYTIKKIEKGKFEFTVQKDQSERRRCLFGRILIWISP